MEYIFRTFQDLYQIGNLFSRQVLSFSKAGRNSFLNPPHVRNFQKYLLIKVGAQLTFQGVQKIHLKNTGFETKNFSYTKKNPSYRPKYIENCALNKNRLYQSKVMFLLSCSVIHNSSILQQLLSIKTDFFFKIFLLR